VTKNILWLVVSAVLFVVLVVARPYSERLHVRCIDKTSGVAFHLSLNFYAPYIWWTDNLGDGWVIVSDGPIRWAKVTMNDRLTIYGKTDDHDFSLNRVSLSAWTKFEDKIYTGMCTSL
jgi:hypothetical protein